MIPLFEKLEKEITNRMEAAVENLAIMTSKGFDSTVTIVDFNDLQLMHKSLRNQPLKAYLI
ncbi:MAG: hypothetical protein IPN13_17850 [Bacteroidetes bacterium]|nr:hypothetical protein [Bacteroidota bacterium]